MILIGLVGCGGFGREVMPLLRRAFEDRAAEAEIVFVLTTEPESDQYAGHRVLSAREFISHPAEQKFYSIAIADSRARESIGIDLLREDIRPIPIASPSAEISKECSLQDDYIICSGSIITSNAKIGRSFHCNIQSYVAHDVVIGDYVTLAPRVACNGNVFIGDHAYIGTGACLKPGRLGKPLRIGCGAVVGMGAVVLQDVPAGEVWAGSPAKCIRTLKPAG